MSSPLPAAPTKAPILAPSNSSFLVSPFKSSRFSASHLQAAKSCSKITPLGPSKMAAQSEAVLVKDEIPVRSLSDRFKPRLFCYV